MRGEGTGGVDGGSSDGRTVAVGGVAVWRGAPAPRPDAHPSARTPLVEHNHTLSRPSTRHDRSHPMAHLTNSGQRNVAEIANKRRIDQTVTSSMQNRLKRTLNHQTKTSASK